MINNNPCTEVRNRSVLSPCYEPLLEQNRTCSNVFTNVTFSGDVTLDSPIFDGTVSFLKVTLANITGGFVVLPGGRLIFDDATVLVDGNFTLGEDSALTLDVNTQINISNCVRVNGGSTLFVKLEDYTNITIGDKIPVLMSANQCIIGNFSSVSLCGHFNPCILAREELSKSFISVLCYQSDHCLPDQYFFIVAVIAGVIGGFIILAIAVAALFIRKRFLHREIILKKFDTATMIQAERIDHETEY